MVLSFLFSSPRNYSAGSLKRKIPRNGKLWAVATIIPFVILGFWEHGNGKMLAEGQAAYRAVTQQEDASPPTRKKN